MAIRSARLGLAASTVLLLGCASAPPHSAGTLRTSVALDYYPLLPGWGWAYEIEREGTTVLSLYSVSERQPDRAVVKHGEETIDYAILADGIARREGDVAGDYILRLPLAKGGSWPVTDGTATIAEVDKTVTLPTGTFRDCAVVEEVRRAPNRVTRTTYCRDAGPVEVEMRVFSPLLQAYEVYARARIMNVSRPEDSGHSTP
jgi:hypothetical protein